MIFVCSTFEFQRSYRPALFSTAIERIESRNITTSSRIEVLYNLSQQVQRLADEKNREEMDLSDAPDEFRGRKNIVSFSVFLWKISRVFQIR